MKKHFNCPACNKFNNKIYFKSVKKDLSFPNFNYLKCNCSTIYVSNKNLNSKKLEKLHQLNWHKNNKFKFSEKKDRNKIINNWYKKYKKLNLNKNSKALDIGCGDGLFCYTLKKMGFKKIYGFDTDIKVIKSLQKEKGKDLNFFCDNFGNFDKNKNIKNIKFDYVFLHGVLEHSYEPQKLMNKIKNIINKNTKIFIFVPNGETLQMDLLKAYNWTSFAPYHRTLFSAQGLGIFLKKLKFKKIKFIEDRSKSWGWTRGISWKLKQEKDYTNLRKSKKFRNFDFLIDNLLEDISISMQKMPFLFLQTSLK
tara:strand:- start:203 stop:1126 length:924 start_codon:yes stop_codon:yes gene_type:complete